ncbi:MAG: DoxX family protein [Solirubrobacterales bacterium]
MRLSRTALAAFFSFAGIMHFLRPRPYEAIVPPPFPKRESVAISGVAEIVGGLAVLHPATRHGGRWGLIALLLAVFPANVWMAVSPKKIPVAGKIPRWALWARLPLQPLAMLWVWRATER